LAHHLSRFQAISRRIRDGWDNTDVRLPAEDEKWRGGMVVGGAGGSSEPIQQVTLVLDAVFFLDGEFVRPE
jgi:hypothetical protein